MFKFVVDDAKRYKSATDPIVNLIDEGLLEVGKEGLFLRAMDPSQIAMISFSMPKTSFVEFDAPSPSAKIGLDFDNLSKILSRTRGGEKLEISRVENKVQLKFVGAKRKRSFKVPILDMPAGVTKEPSVQHDAVIKVHRGKKKADVKLGAEFGEKENGQGLKALRAVSPRTGYRGSPHSHDQNLKIEYYTKRDLSRASWSKVAQIKTGQYIATVDGWEKVTGMRGKG